MSNGSNHHPKQPNETADRIIYAVILALVVFGGISFCIEPKYEKGVWAILGLLGATLTGATGFKFGVTTATPGVSPPSGSIELHASANVPADDPRP